jgi:hypothetical protein
MPKRSFGRHGFKLSLLAVVGLTALALSPLPPPSPTAPVAHADAPRVDRTPAPVQLQPPAALTDEPKDLTVDPVSELGQGARGMYFNADVAAALGARGLVQVVKAARMNAVVIDFKDERGRISYNTKQPMLKRRWGAVLGDAADFVREVREGGVYVIGRIVCFNDPKLPREHPELAIMDNRPYKRGEVWGNWTRRNPWLDPYNHTAQDLLVEVAKEVAAVGVDEIQLDYVRFPVDPATQFAEFPAKTDQPRSEVIARMLARMDAAIAVPISVDIFGLATMPWGKPEPLGQIPEQWAKHVEIFSPMLYINGMSAWRYKDNGPRAERLVALGVSTLRKRIGDTPVIRPFLQAFPQGADYYDVEFITEQIRGAKRASADGFLFWHPASRYELVREANTSGPAKGLAPFSLLARAELRSRAWSDAQSRSQ